MTVFSFGYHLRSGVIFVIRYKLFEIEEIEKVKCNLLQYIESNISWSDFGYIGSSS